MSSSWTGGEGSAGQGTTALAAETPEMVRRVMDAIGDSMNPSDPNWLEICARAAIGEIRAAAEERIASGNAARARQGLWSMGVAGEAFVYRAMIDAALKGEGGQSPRAPRPDTST